MKLLRIEKNCVAMLFNRPPRTLVLTRERNLTWPWTLSKSSPEFPSQSLSTYIPEDVHSCQQLLRALETKYVDNDKQQFPLHKLDDLSVQKSMNHLKIDNSW